MATDVSEDDSNIKSHLKIHTDVSERILNAEAPFKFQVPKTVLEEREKSWNDLFEKYSMETNDVVELNLETLQLESDKRENYVSECRVPMRNPIACVQYWVDTGKPPCNAYDDENYNLNTESSLSESVKSDNEPLQASSPPRKYNLLHSPQPANVPKDVLNRTPPIISPDIVNIQRSASSTNNVTKESLNFTMNNPDIVIKTNTNTDDVDVDVCGTDDLSKFVEGNNEDKLNSNDDYSQNLKITDNPADINDNEPEGLCILREMCEKSVTDDPTVMKVTTGSLKIGDVIPSIREICDRADNFNHDHIYCEKSPSDNSEDLIEFVKQSRPRTPSPLLIKKSFNDTKELNRRKLFTNRNSPIELVKPSGNCFRKSSVIGKFHPALESPAKANRSSLKRKKLFLKRKTLLPETSRNTRSSTIMKKNNELEKNKDAEMKDEVFNLVDSNEEFQEKKSLLRQKNEKVSKSSDQEDFVKEKQLSGQKLTRLTLRNKMKIVHDDNLGRDIKKAQSKKRTREGSTRVINCNVKNEVKLRELYVSLERLSIEHIEKLLNKSFKKKSVSVVESNQDLTSKESLIVPEKKIESLEVKELSGCNKRKYKIDTIYEESDEDEIPLKKRLSNNVKLKKKENFTNLARDFNNTKIREDLNINSLKFTESDDNFSNLNDNSKSTRKTSYKVIFTLSSDEEDDFMKIIEKSLNSRKSKNSENKLEFRQISNVRDRINEISKCQDELESNFTTSRVSELTNNGINGNSKSQSCLMKGNNSEEFETKKSNCDKMDRKPVLTSILDKTDSFKNSDRRISKFMIVPSDSSDSDDSVQLRTENMINPRKNSRKSLKNVAKTSNRKLNFSTLNESSDINYKKLNFVTLQESSDSSDDLSVSNNIKLFEEKKIENKLIAKRKSEKSDVSNFNIDQNYSDSGSEMFELFFEEKSNLDENSRPSKRYLRSSKKRKKSRLISSVDEKSESDIEILDKRVPKKRGILLASDILRSEMTNSSLNIFSEEYSRSSSENIFDSQRSFSGEDDEEVLKLNFKNNIQIGENNTGFEKKTLSGKRLQVFQTKFSDSDSD